MSISSKLKFTEQAFSFLEKLWSDLERAKIQIEDHWNVDHLCYRVETEDLYQSLKSQFAQFGQLLVESEVNGRMIATYKLDSPLSFKHWQISVVELPAPKTTKPTRTGFEHVEIVCDISFDVLRQKYSHLQLDLGGLNKDFNQELEIHLGLRNLKFHHLSLESVVRLESNEKIWKALRQSQVLKLLKEHQALVAGTFPLGLQLEHSDLDILIQIENLDDFSAKAHKLWAAYEGFHSRREVIGDLESLIIYFKFQGVPFEIFAQNCAPVEQKAYRHFQLEEKLLEFGGPALQARVLSLRKTFGLKTEPAFAQALGLEGDSFQVLLDLQKRSNQELRSLVSACLSKQM